MNNVKLVGVVSENKVTKRSWPTGSESKIFGVLFPLKIVAFVTSVLSSSTVVNNLPSSLALYTRTSLWVLENGKNRHTLNCLGNRKMFELVLEKMVVFHLLRVGT
jgi:hypothetical protein